MTRPQRLGLLGGTFDPIHYGHLDAAEAARAALALDEVRLIPSHDPPHRPLDPKASAFHRFALVALAIDGRTSLRAADQELAREGLSYTIDTLQALHREGWPAAQLFFILGADAFAEIATWRSFPAVLDAANFAVIARPGATIERAIRRVPERHRRIGDTAANIGVLPDSSQTAIYLVEARTRDVSSTTIRARLSRGEPIDDLVPAAVARHILAHDLYKAVNQLHGQDTHRHE
jgi:nicotinate-nucleotide adenylyltransferase